MTTIIAAIAVGLILLWGGILGLFKLVDSFERKHLLGLGAYTTLVAGLVMGLVLFTVQERQKEHQREMEAQIKAVTDQLNDLSNRMLAQLEEKADLTASEFQIRANLQHEKADHKRTREDLAQQEVDYAGLKNVLDRERKTQRQYQDEQNNKIEDRFKQETERYQKVQDFLDRLQRSTQNMQKQLVTIQGEASKLNSATNSLQAQQNKLLGKLTSAQQARDLNTQKTDALARSLQALHETLEPTIAAVDSLYTWKKK